VFQYSPELRRARFTVAAASTSWSDCARLLAGRAFSNVLFTTQAEAARIPKIAANVDDVIRPGTVSHHVAATATITNPRVECSVDMKGACI
jgi:hypothetical protein